MPLRVGASHFPAAAPQASADNYPSSLPILSHSIQHTPLLVRTPIINHHPMQPKYSLNKSTKNFLLSYPMPSMSYYNNTSSVATMKLSSSSAAALQLTDNTQSLFTIIQLNSQHYKNDNAIKSSGYPNKTNVLIHLAILLILLQLIPFVLVYYIEECSPLVLFSWWRNKIS